MTDAKKANPMVDFSFVMIKKLTTVNVDNCAGVGVGNELVLN